MAGEAWAINASAGAPSYDAGELRRLFSALLSQRGSNAFSGTQGPRLGYGAGLTSLAGSTITVVAHAGVISPDLSAGQGAYLYQLPTNETHTLTAAHLTLARTDLVYMQISDHDEDASGARTVASGYLAGTAGAGVPSLPARSFELARIAVPASGGGSPSLTERGTRTVAAGGIGTVRDATDLADSSILAPYEGRVAALLSTDRLMIHDGSAWQRGPHWSVAGRTGVRLYQNLHHITNAVQTPIIWDTEDQDSDGFWSAGTPTVITIPAGCGGLYAITFNIVGAVGVASGTHSFVQLTMTSSLTNLPNDFRKRVEPQDDRGLISVTVPLLAGDSFTCDLYHETGTNEDYECFLSCYRIGV